ncbi:microcin C transport system substrate-binding protein [Pseudorhodobacter antarcticus]|uniref:Microcin C transport system substrate-binding protein n=1 Tax=Pseudorhodobacter antarcticus TaxID=1077947 RepID=A0A1H8AF90_9RHOB|nr:extracellular solute-binding protein [Pseudorhodobacter antarcticus]SEM69435.1 microcin C transport system substrate-binding protein [Pseudorhodobacter antarcticus]
MQAKTARAVQPMTAGLIGGALIMALAAFATAARAETVITAHGISTFGELNLAPDFKHLAYVNPNAPKGGEISQWTSGGFDSMNPYSIKGRAAALASAPYESILEGTDDEVGAAYCLLCSTLEYPEDRSWVIFNLRDDVKFSDGTPLTAEDVIFSYETFLTKGLTDFRTIFATKVEKVEALDPMRVKFTFKPGIPTRDLPQDVGGLPIMSKAHAIANNLDMAESSLTPFLGSGPYALGSMRIGQSVTYKRNPDYWGINHPMRVGTNNFDTIRIEYFADYDAAFVGFVGGTYTFRNEASSIKWATGYDFPAVLNGGVIKAELPSGAKSTGQSFIFNLRREKFQDSRVREAIGLMFNFEWSDETLFYGIYDRIPSYWGNSFMEAKGVPSPAEAALLQPLVDDGLIGASLLTNEAIMPPVSGARQLDRGNLRRASALLDAAGWPVGADGMRRNAKNELLRVEFLNDSASFDRVINPFVENLRSLGVDAVMTRVDNAQMEDRTRPPNYDFDMTNHFAQTSIFSGTELKQYYGSETADVSSFNAMGLKSPAVDRMIEVVLAADSLETLTTATMALDRVMRAERFAIFQWYKGTHTIAYYDIFEHPENLPPYALGEMSFWWYNAEKAAALKASGVLK